MNKKIIIGGVLVVVLLAVLTVLNTGKIGTQKRLSGSDNFSGGMVVPGSTGLPGGSISMGLPMTKNDAAVRESAVAPIAVDNVGSDITDKKVIKNGDLTLKVNSVDKAAENISKISKDNGGDVFSSNVYNYNNIKSGTVMVKVPVANFGKTFSEIKKVAALVVQESTSGQDVTEQFTDLQAQLKNKQAEEQQFLQIMNQAQKIQDILDVTQQLSRVRGEIEQLQGQLKFLNSQTDMASISVNLSEDSSITITDSWRPWQVVKDAVNSLVKKGQGFIDFTIVLIVTVIPVAILYLLLAYVIYVIGSKIYTKFKK
ncbi:MAG: DUF4349 domain-containing protein [Parcubacteria group bacterium]|jgi:PKD repeat protein